MGQGAVGKSQLFLPNAVMRPQVFTRSPGACKVWG
jgi:hypothetical protein